MKIRHATWGRALAGAALVLALAGCASHPSDHNLVDHSVAEFPRETATPTPTPKVETTEVSETSPVPYSAVTQNDPTLPQGQSKVVTAGVAGVMTTTFRVVTTDGVETSRTQISQVVTTTPVNEVTAIGTYVAPPPPPAAAAHGTVVPGGFCSPADQGVTATAANGRSYTCGGKGPDASGHLHWNT